MKKTAKNPKTYHRIPLLSAFLNIVISGTGYIYNGKRILFGILLLIFELLQWLWLYVSPEIKTISSQPLGVLTFLIFTAAIAIDAYLEAMEINKQNKT